MAHNGTKLPPNKAKAILALLEHPTIATAAKAAKVGQRTLTRWLSEDEEFKRALTEAQTRALDQTITRLAAGGPIAADILLEIASSDFAKPSVRVQAASRILSEQRAGFNMITLKNEIEGLKRQVNELEKRSG